MEEGTETVTEFIPGVWYPIETAPKDDRRFFVGAWEGERLHNDDYTKWVWDGMPTWTYSISHNENPQGPHETRGWNHRNGPLNVSATHWSPGLIPPPFEDVVAMVVKRG